jgi:hypothetical protein
MLRTALFAVFVLGQAAALLVAGIAALWWSQDLMAWLIHVVGEERALGARNVIRREDGSTLLTNPGGMILWMMPFWALGCLQITAALTLVGLWLSRLTSRCGGPRPRAALTPSSWLARPWPGPLSLVVRRRRHFPSHRR